MSGIALFQRAARMDRAAVRIEQIAMIVVFAWIGGLKAAKYKADRIVPFIGAHWYTSSTLIQTTIGRT